MKLGSERKLRLAFFFELEASFITTSVFLDLGFSFILLN